MNTLEKIENAIEFIENENIAEIEVLFSYAELRDYRRHLLLTKLNEELSAENLHKGIKLKYNLK